MLCVALSTYDGVADLRMAASLDRPTNAVCVMMVFFVDSAFSPMYSSNSMSLMKIGINDAVLAPSFHN